MGIRRTFSTLAACALIATACSSEDSGGVTSTANSAASTPSEVADTTVAAATTTAAPALAAATFVVRPGVEQLTVLDGSPGDEISLTRDAAPVASGTVDEQGSLLFDNIKPGPYVVSSATETSDVVTVMAPDEVPPTAFYQEQPTLPAGGFGYVATRDGTTLSANVVLPGPADEGPYPTVVEYSGYSPSNPSDAAFAQVFTAQGFAYVGVNVRGTGCSGGAFQVFDTMQNYDGYDVVEAIAAQSWVADNKVGMVGISYPGIMQLFVAQTQPPSLSAISPLSVIDDLFRSTLYPGGMLNTGFAYQFTSERFEEAKPFGQAWTKEQADSGDDECANNQRVRLQNPDGLALVDANKFYDPALADALNPSTFVDDINVPVFIAGAWDDEQTGAHFAAMLPDFTSSPHVYATLVNGLHTESLSPPVAGRLFEFLQLYVAKRVPDVSVGNTIAGLLGGPLFGVTEFRPLENRFAGMTYAEALAAFEAEPPVRVLFEQGGDEGFAPGTPEPNFVEAFDAWPIPSAVNTVWNLSGSGALVSGPPTGEASSSYAADPTLLPETFYKGGRSSQIWQAGTEYAWEPLPEGSGLGFVTDPLAADTVLAGQGSVDLWVQADAADTDIEVTLSEVRPDGTEIFVQSAVQRASQRALDEAASTELTPVHTNAEADAADLPAGEFSLVRIDLFPFAHPFRAGSRIRLTVDAPGNNRPVWAFDTISAGEQVTIAHDADHPSRLVLSTIPDIVVPSPAPPACGALRGQPCRPWIRAANGG